MSWDNWDGTKPKLDEAKFLAPDTPKHRSKKNRRKWCRGKTGVEHVPELQLSKWTQYHLASGKLNPGNRWSRQHLECHWDEGQHWEFVDGKMHWAGNGEFAWACRHEYWCANCGKILDKVGRNCPDFHPHELDWKR